MSVLIKGMEMPKSCGDCPMMQDEWVSCKLTGSWEWTDEFMPSKERLKDCPLVPVPAHGRLIDADALVEILLKVIDINASIEQRNEATEQERRCLWWFEQQIGIAPTIIPAEEGE